MEKSGSVWVRWAVGILFVLGQGSADWYSQQAGSSVLRILENFRGGAILASPSRLEPNEPDYYYHWTRDAALTANAVLELFLRSNDPVQKRLFFERLTQYLRFSRLSQLTSMEGVGLGEPKFHVDGSVYKGDWGRPQNDGPALRALVGIRLGNWILDSGGRDSGGRKTEGFLQDLYDGKLPTESLVKADLEFISHHWREESFDLWEEVKGTHFFTRVVQLHALRQGAQFARRMEDPGAAAWYELQARSLEAEMPKFWHPLVGGVGSQGYLTASLNHEGRTGLDTGTLLGVLQSGSDGPFALDSEEVLLTVLLIERSFAGLYPINSNSNESLGMAIGRYREDTYNGMNATRTEGNPWVLTTCAFAEYYARLFSLLSSRQKIEVTEVSAPFYNSLLFVPKKGKRSWKAVTVGQIIEARSETHQKLLSQIRTKAVSFMERVRWMADAQGASDVGFPEQWNRRTGRNQGARDLTWSYVSFLRAYWALSTPNQK